MLADCSTITSFSTFSGKYLLIRKTVISPVNRAIDRKPSGLERRAFSSKEGAREAQSSAKIKGDL